MPEKVRLALIGCGGISGAHVNGYKDIYNRGCREFEYTACCDVSEENAKRRADEIAGIQGKRPEVFTDVEKLIKSGLAEAGDICLPHCFHHSVAIQILEGGLHTMVEKPLGITIKASKKTIEAAQKAGLVLATAENVRRYTTARAFRWAISSKKLIGDIKSVDVYSVGYGPFDINSSAMKWRMVKLLTGGGMIMDSGAHFTDMILYMFGEPDEVFCVMETHDTRMVEKLPILGSAPADVEDAWHIIIKFKEGFVVSWTYSRAFPGPGMSYGRYYGTNGVIEDAGFVFHCFQGGGRVKFPDNTNMSTDDVVNQYKATLSEDEKSRLFPYGCGDGFGIEIWDFCNAIRTGRKPDLDGEAGMKAKALCEACYESSNLGKTVKYADVLSGKICEYQKPIDEYWKIQDDENLFTLFYYYTV